MSEWYQLEVDQTLNELNVNLQSGLSAEEVRLRQEKYGPNELVERGRKSPWKILWEQLTGIMVVILIIAAVVSLILHEPVDAVAILAIIILNTVLGFTQEYRAEKAMAALKKMAIAHVRVRRDGRIQEISATELVPGDVFLLEAGNSIPADARVVESANLRAQESILTGESEPVDKSTKGIDRDNLPLGDRVNVLYMGTAITFGRGSAVVTGTGMQTELGHIADLIQGVGSEATPLQRRLAQLGRGLAMVALGIVALVFVIGLVRGSEIRELILTSISMAVAAVPEGLPAVVTIALALGAQRMLKRSALIRKLPAVETLGSVTVICSDKTGTLTQNRMTVTLIDIAGHRMDFQEEMRSYSPTLQRGDETLNPVLSSQPDTIPFLLACSALCNDASLEENPNHKGSLMAMGDPTEGALVIAAAHAGIWKEKLEKLMPRAGEAPFEFDRKRMTTVHPLPLDPIPDPFLPLWTWKECQPGALPPFIGITKGAVDGLLDCCTQVWDGSQVTDLNDEWLKRIAHSNDELAGKGMRILGVAFRLLTEVAQKPEELEQNLIFIGLMAMIDPARPEVKDAVAVCQAAGIRPMMITGDHPLTAVYIGKLLGFTSNDEVLTGQDLGDLSLEELSEKVKTTSIFARVSPEHKLKIVNALQNQGHIVAMTGDGVNDAPALKKADIGVAMGITGTDVSKEAADMVLLDDNFSTIVAAVEEGRRIYDNIRKFIKYVLTSNAGELWVMLAAPFLGMPLPLLPLQILWVNLITDGLPGLGLTIEPVEEKAMHRPPYNPKENIFARGMGVDIFWIGLLVGAACLGLGYWAWSTGSAYWQTMVFTSLTLGQMGNVLALRTESESVFRKGLFSNRAVAGAVVLTILLQMAVVYVPFLQGVFKTAAASVE